jgi:hypothetical protein
LFLAKVTLRALLARGIIRALEICMQNAKRCVIAWRVAKVLKAPQRTSRLNRALTLVKHLLAQKRLLRQA